MSTRSTAMLFALVALVAGAASAGDVEVLVRGFEPGKGPIRVAAFADESDFDANRPFASVQVRAAGVRVRAMLRDLPPGAYAFAVFQDLNGDERLSKNLLGIPKEPYGFSNGARGRLGPPEFGKTAVTVKADALSLEIELK